MITQTLQLMGRCRQSVMLDRYQIDSHLGHFVLFA